MLSSSERLRLCVVLVGARNPQNIGAAARAMQDFGFTDLRVVNGFAPPFEAAQLEAKSAVGAGEVMRAARLFLTLVEAIADCHVVVGTTAIGGRSLEQPILTLQEGAPLLGRCLAAADSKVEIDRLSRSCGQDVRVHSPRATRVALLFGSEKTGLTRDHLSFCSLLLTVPLWKPEGRHLSMNLGQAVAVCLYELSRTGFEGSRELPPPQNTAASVADRERLLELLLRCMQQTGYTKRFPANSRPTIVRRLVDSLGTNADEAATWMGFLKAVLQRTSESEDPPLQRVRAAPGDSGT